MKTTWDYTQLASNYDARPDYSVSAVDDLLTTAGIESSDLVADIGAGTGKLTKLLLEQRLTVHAVEPNEAMRALGIANTSGEAVQWSEGTGEHNGLPDKQYRLITFGSSFNVTERQDTLVETARCLIDGGWFACMWNHRDLEDPLQNEVEQAIHARVAQYTYGSRREDQTATIDSSELFGPVTRIEGRVTHTVSVATYMAAWRSHATLERQTSDAFEAVLDAIEALLEGLESVTVPYATRLYCAQLRG